MHVYGDTQAECQVAGGRCVCTRLSKGESCKLQGHQACHNQQPKTQLNVEGSQQFQYMRTCPRKTVCSVQAEDTKGSAQVMRSHDGIAVFAGALTIHAITKI